MFANYVRLSCSPSSSGRGHINISFRCASFKLFEPLKFLAAEAAASEKINYNKISAAAKFKQNARERESAVKFNISFKGIIKNHAIKA